MFDEQLKLYFFQWFLLSLQKGEELEASPTVHRECTLLHWFRLYVQIFSNSLSTIIQSLDAI
jgi:hypothetical protein